MLHYMTKCHFVARQRFAYPTTSQACGRGRPSARPARPVLSPPCSPTLLRRLRGRATPPPPCLAARQFRITKQFLDDLAPSTMERTIHGLRRALLICHAARDAIVGID